MTPVHAEVVRNTRSAAAETNNLREYHKRRATLG